MLSIVNWIQIHKDETNPNPTIYSAINKEDDMVKRERQDLEETHEVHVNCEGSVLLKNFEVIIINYFCLVFDWPSA